jgi:cytochrome c oxidase assembly protein subunit 11
MQIAPYFAKVECFCFEEQRLLAGEEVDLPVFFFIDRDFVDDPLMKDVREVTLSYTFLCVTGRAPRNRDGGPC